LQSRKLTCDIVFPAIALNDTSWPNY